MAEVRYIRNMRPNMFLVRLYPRTPNQITFKLGRRGERTDSVAVPSDAFNDHSFLRNLRQEHIEEISQEVFMALGARDEDWPQDKLKERTPHGVSSAFDPEVRIPHGMLISVPDSSETFLDPYAVEKFEKSLMEPRLEFAKVSDSEEDAKRALREAGIAEEKKKDPKTTPKRKITGDPKKFEELNRLNAPRKGMIKGVVGGEEAHVIEDE